MARIRPDRSKKKKKPKSKAAMAEQMERRRRMLRVLIHCFAIVAVTGGFLIGYNALAQHVRQQHTMVRRPPAIALVNQPAWMTRSIATELAEQLAAAVPERHSVLDHDLLVRLHGLLSQSAWVEEVNRIRRAKVEGQDTILIDCNYRTPLAIVRWGNGRQSQYRLVGEDAVLLPPEYDWDEVKPIIAGRNAATNLRIITGVTKPPPATAGTTWDSDPLRAGLGVAALLHGFPAARDITVIDVSQVGRTDVPQVVLRTRYDTEIWWGQPPKLNDFLIEVSPQTKLRHLQTVYEQFHGDYPKWVDLRWDAVTYRQADPDRS